MTKIHLPLMLVVAVFVGAAGVGLLWAQTTEEETPLVRINARSLSDGLTEFGLQRQENGTWGRRILPTRRFLPDNSPTGRWLNSSPVSLSDIVDTKDNSDKGVTLRNPYTRVYGDSLIVTTVSSDRLFDILELRIQCEFGRLSAAFSAFTRGAGYADASLDRDRGYAIGMDGSEYTELHFSVGHRSVRHSDAKPFVQRLSKAKWLSIVMYKWDGGYISGTLYVQDMFSVAGAHDVLVCD